VTTPVEGPSSRVDEEADKEVVPRDVRTDQVDVVVVVVVRGYKVTWNESVSDKIYWQNNCKKKKISEFFA
jgi:hypothetical protein